jgi:hypothetical protein
MKKKRRKKKEQDVLVCVSFDDEHVELSELDVCRECGARIWVSPTGRAMQRDKNLKIICASCMPDPTEPGVEFAQMTPEQAAELLHYFQTRPRG